MFKLSMSLARASLVISTVKCQRALLPCDRIWPGGFRWPAATGPSQSMGTLRSDVSARLTHSSMDAVVLGHERDAPSERLRMMGMGLYDSGSPSAMLLKLLRCSSDAGELVMERNLCGVPA